MSGGVTEQRHSRPQNPPRVSVTIYHHRAAEPQKQTQRVAASEHRAVAIKTEQQQQGTDQTHKQAHTRLRASAVSQSTSEYMPEHRSEPRTITETQQRANCTKTREGSLFAIVRAACPI